MKQFIALDKFQKDTISDAYEGRNMAVRISDLAEVCKRITIYDEATTKDSLAQYVHDNNFLQIYINFLN